MYHQPYQHTALPRARLQPITRTPAPRELCRGFAHDMLELSAHPALTTEMPRNLAHAAPSPGRVTYPHPATP